MLTGFVWEKIFTEHDMGVHHPESPERLLRIKRELDSNPEFEQLVKIPAREALRREVCLIHSESYFDAIIATDGKSATLDPDTSTSPASCKAALTSAGGTIEAVDAVMNGVVTNAFALTRPPGHHAEKDHAMGFCIFNNIAIAAERTIKKFGLKRVVIIDFDVHHGNGTEHAFYDRSDVYYISTHRSPFYPGTGAADDRGKGKGLGFNLNIPLKFGASDNEFKKAYSEIVLPAIDKYRPELILISAGYDAHLQDPMGGMEISTSCYNWLMSEFVRSAGKHCGGKLVAALEGGYNTGVLAICVMGALREMMK